MDNAKLRAWWWHRQGLDGSLAGASPADVLARAGWARSVGGANPYLTVFARAGTARATIDADVAALRIYELPSARGCTYVLPADHFGLGLQVGRDAPLADVRTLEKLGVPRAELSELEPKVRKALSGKVLDPAALKELLGGAVRDLGPDGRKRGMATTLPPVLGLLQAAGQIRRVPSNGRLDQQRYSYTAWEAPASGRTDAQARAELARLYFDWIGPASLAHLRWFSGFSVADTTAAVADLGLVDIDDGLVAPQAIAAAFSAFKAPAKPQYALLTGIDSLILLRRDIANLVDGDVPAPGKSGPLIGAPDLDDHPIVDRGHIIGLWQYDPDAAELVTYVFDGQPDKALREAIARTEAYVRDQLGDARSFSLDSAKSRAPRIAALRAAADRRD